TGTLTEGRPKVVQVGTAAGFDETDLLRLAASVEQASEHPLGQAIVEAAKDRGIAPAKVTGFDSPTGKGAIGMVEDKRIAIGNPAVLKEIGADIGGLASEADAMRR